MRRADFLTIVVLAVGVALPKAAAAQGPTTSQATGTLRLAIEPPSLVLIDNEQIGQIEKRSIELPVGPHRVRVVHPDFQPLRRTIDVRASELIELRIDLYDRGVPRDPAHPPQRPAPTRPVTRRTEERPVSAPIAPEPPDPAPPAPPTPAPAPAVPAPAVSATAVAPPAVPAPAVPVPAPVLDAEIRVRIEPPAEVWVDNVRQGVYGEGTIAVSTGRHDVRIEHNDYQPLNRRLTVTREKPAVLDLKLADRAVPKVRPQP